MGDHRKLTAWQVASEMVRDTYRATARMPTSERYGLTSQIRKSAVSVVANIAEGAGRDGEKEFRRFLRIARGSVQELIAEIALAIDLGFIAPEDGRQLLGKADRVASMLLRLIRSPLKLSRIGTPESH